MKLFLIKREKLQFIEVGVSKHFKNTWWGLKYISRNVIYTVNFQALKKEKEKKDLHQII